MPQGLAGFLCISGIVLLSAASLSPGMCVADGQSTGGEVATGEDRAEGVLSPNGTALRYEVGWETGSVSHLRGLLLSQEADGRQEASGVVALADSFSLHFHATLSTISLSQSIDTSLVYASFRDGSAEFRTASGSDPAISRSFAEEMMFPLLVMIDGVGRISRIGFDTSTSVIYQNFIRGLFSLLQFRIPSAIARVGDEERQEEFNTTGKYAARYRVEAESQACLGKPYSNGAISIRKTRESFKAPRRSPICGEISNGTRITTTGEIQACVDTALRSVVMLRGDLSEHVRVGMLTASRSTSTISLRLVDRMPLSADTVFAMRQRAANLRASGVSRRIFEELAPPKVTVAEDTAGLSSVDELLLLRQIDSVETRPDSARLDDVRRNVGLLVRGDRSFCGRLVEKLSRKNTSATLLQMVSGVFAEAQIEEAHEGLIALVRYFAGDFQRYLLLMPAVGRIRNPSASLERALWGLADSGEPPVRNAAEGALGVLVHCMSREAGERREAIAQRLSDRLKNADTEQRKSDLISVLGNTATATGAHVVSQYLMDSSDQVRRASASALRWAETTRADTLLAGMLLSDASALVRQGVMDALGWRDAERVTVDAELAAVARDTDSAVRQKALRHLFNIRMDYPEVEGVLARVAEHDASKDVRQVAKDLLKIAY